MRKTLLTCCILASRSLLHAAEPTPAPTIQVDPVSGEDSGNGRAKPLKSIARAIKLAQPGDTIHLAPGTYHESAEFLNKSGTPEHPIILDGHGAILDGSEPVRSEAWESLGKGLFRKEKLLPRIEAFAVSRWYFIWDGKMNHMGRTSKGPKAPFKSPAELQPGEWTYVEAEAAFYLRVAENQTLDSANIRYPARANGVSQSGTGSHLTIRNITVTHVYNDGFNVHGPQKALRFENIAAIECGDDGFSAHETAECVIEGFVSLGNSTGLCDIQSSVTHYKNVLIRDCIGYDVFFIGDSAHSMENVLVESSAVRTLQVSPSPEQSQNAQVSTGSVILKNVLFRRKANTPGEANVGRLAKLALEHCSFRGLHFSTQTGADVQMSHCLFSGDPKPTLSIASDTLWKGQGNTYSLESLRLGNRTFTETQFGEFQKAIGSESDSVWSAPEDSLSGAGIDESVLRSTIAPQLDLPGTPR